MHRVFLNVGYKLFEGQLRPYFAKFGAITDLYLPKHVNGRNKGYGFLTYATKRALLSVVQQNNHIVDGEIVQVRVAGPRPVEETQPRASPCTYRHPDFSTGHRLYVGGIADAVTTKRIQQHFARWGDVLDVYFPAARGSSKSRYCFVTFGNHESAQQAYKESERSIDGWPLKSISMAEARKEDGHQAPPQAGKIRRSGALETPASATLHTPRAADSHPLGLESLPHGTNTNQVYQSAPVAHIDSLPINQAAGACGNWNGISFPLPGSSVCTGDREGFVAGLGSTGSSLIPDHLAMLAQQSILEASGHRFSGAADSIPLPSFQEQCFDG